MHLGLRAAFFSRREDNEEVGQVAKSLCSGTWLSGFKSYNRCLATRKGFKICLWIL